MSVPEPQWRQAVHQLASAERVALACHVMPDGDALGSMLALGAALRAQGTQVVASWGGAPFEVPASYAYLPFLDLLVRPEDFPEAPELLVTLDCAHPRRLGSLQSRLATAGCTVVVDHHATSTRYGDLNLVDEEAAATVVLVAELLNRLEVPLTAELAIPLYTGLVTDTGSFRHRSTTPAVHQLAARLLTTGIRHDLVTRSIYDTAPFGWVHLLGRVCARARLEPEAVGGLGLVWTVVDREDLASTGLRLADVEGVVDVLRRTQEAEVAAVVKASPDDGGWVVSTRSRDAVDVGAVCSALGGGGHFSAAGYSAAGEAEQVLDRLRDALAHAPHVSP